MMRFAVSLGTRGLYLMCVSYSGAVRIAKNSCFGRTSVNFSVMV